MIIESIEVRNFLSHEHSVVDFTGSPLTLVCGDNGAGKSSLFDAAEYILYGHHRGGKQDHRLLVKDGAKRATVRIVVAFDGVRYRIARQIDAKDGNQPATVEYWNRECGTWTPLNVGDHVQDAWTWLERRLPDYDLFRSAIYLRQGETAHFLSGQAGKRLERFAALVDLSPYTELAERAKARRDKAQQRQHDAEKHLEMLGDLSPEALTAIMSRVQEAGEEYRLAQVHVTRMLAIAAGAREWAGLLREQATITEQRDQARALIADAEQIREAADRVQRWERTQPVLDRYWEARHRSQRHRDESVASIAAAEEHRLAYEERCGELERLNVRQQELNDLELPGAHSRLDAQRAAIEGLALEISIARALVTCREAERQAEDFRDLDTEVEHWNARQRALPLLRQLVSACHEAEQSQRSLAQAQEEFIASEASAASAAQDATRAAEEEANAQHAVDAASLSVRNLSEELARISGSIESHARLRGNEEACPVCARVLDTNAHKHVQLVLASERQQATELCETQAAARQGEAEALAALEEAQRKLQRARTLHQNAIQAHVRVQERVELAQKAVELSRLRREDLHSEVTQVYGPYAQNAATLTAEEVEVEGRCIKRGLAEVAKRTTARNAVHQMLLRARAEADTHRAHRQSGADPLGESFTVEELEYRHDAARESLSVHQRAFDVLNQEFRDVQSGLQILTGELASHGAKRDAAQKAAEQARKAADIAAGEVQDSASKIGSEWSALLEDEEDVIRVSDVVNVIRPLADRLTDLEQAQGRLTHLIDALSTIQAKLDQIPPEHQLSSDEADAGVSAARIAESEASVRHAQAVNDQSDFIRRRGEADLCEDTIDVEGARAQIYDELFELLKEGGPIQVEVAEQEQRRICDEVNSVLNLLGDPLRVTLGDARRTRGVELQDVLIVDTSDPFGKPRYFEFLSGGEQFRIAMALALALHRRVGKGGAGTLIVDEGFGALDGNHRDALAQQMTNISQGILHLQLARNIIICSHSVEVQRHFPYRWLITKQDGTATASLTDLMQSETIDAVLVGDL